MDIVSRTPFTLKLIQRFPGYKESVGSKFSMNERDIWENGFYTLAAEENETLEVLFDSADKNARLYLEALDVMPYDDKNLFEDEEGRLYRTVSPESFLLCSSDSTTDTLRVDSFKMSIYCNEKWYYGVLNILPKAMSKKEWKMMKDDLEKEVRGLAQDIIQKNIGIGNKNIKIPPRILYDFMILKKYSKRVIMALMNIAENPKCEIVTEYENVSLQKNNERNFDAATMRRYATRSGCDARWKIPVKRTCYDIQENRLLKNMLQEYDDKLVEFIAILDNAESFNILELYQNVMNIEEIIKETKEKTKIQTSLEIAVRLYKNRLFTPAYISGVTNLNMFDIETLIGIVDSGRCCENDLKILTDNIYEIELKKCNKNSENNKAETEEDQLNLIDPKKLIEYIENIGWIPFGIRRKNDTTLLYKRKNQPITKMDSLVTIPIDKDLWNYKQLLKVAVLQIARTENCTMMEVVKSIIKFRERSGNYGEIKQVRIL